MEELELGRDPNLVKCTDNYEDAVDCRGTRKLLAKFRKLEQQAEDGDDNKGKMNNLLCFSQSMIEEEVITVTFLFLLSL